MISPHDFTSIPSIHAWQREGIPQLRPNLCNIRPTPGLIKRVGLTILCFMCFMGDQKSGNPGCNREIPQVSRVIVISSREHGSSNATSMSSKREINARFPSRQQSGYCSLVILVSPTAGSLTITLLRLDPSFLKSIFQSTFRCSDASSDASRTVIKGIVDKPSAAVGISGLTGKECKACRLIHRRILIDDY